MDIKEFSKKVMVGKDKLKLLSIINRFESIGRKEKIKVLIYDVKKQDQKPLTPDELFHIYFKEVVGSPINKSDQAQVLDEYFFIKEDGFLFRIDNAKEDTSWRIEITPK
jgi:hypothetical protein